MGEEFLRRGRTSLLTQAGDGVERIIRHHRDIDADADNQRVTAVRQPLAFDEDAAGLLSADKNIVRPFDLERLGARRQYHADRLVYGNGNGQRQGTQALHRRRVDQQKRSVEIAAFGNPEPAAAAAAAGLPFGGHPEITAVARPGPGKAFAVGGRCLRQSLVPEIAERYPAPPVGSHQKSVAAASSAAPPIGPPMRT